MSLIRTRVTIDWQGYVLVADATIRRGEPQVGPLVVNLHSLELHRGSELVEPLDFLPVYHQLRESAQSAVDALIIEGARL